MAKKTTSIEINLLPKDPFFETGLGRALKWALSVGRYIVIFTELVVITSFATRFYLDRQVTDLNDAIHQKESIVKSYGDTEEKVRSVQTVIQQYEQIQQQANITDVFPALSSITPQDIRLEELTITPTSVAFSGTTLSQASLNLLINNIQLSDQFFNVSVDRIETNAGKTAGFTFKIKADTQDTRRKPTTPKAPGSTSSPAGETQ
jgi:Tfp pilus assembly protein PilN